MNKCSKCGRENRNEARFCRFCGAPIEQESDFTGFYGKKNIEREFTRFRARAKAAGLVKGHGADIGLDCLITGESGTGKLFLADKLYDVLLSGGVVENSKYTLVDASEFDKWMEKFDDNLKVAGKGALVITNSQKLLPGGLSSDVNKLDRLFARMRSSAGKMPPVFLCGLKQGMDSFIDRNPDAASLFECRFNLRTLSKEDLAAICQDRLRSCFKLDPTPEFSDKLLRRFDWMLRNNVQGGGHLADTEAQEAGVSALLKGSGKLGPDDIRGEVFVPRTEAEVWAEMDKFIGLQTVKDEMHAIIDGVREARKEGGSLRLDDHYVFTGNPGTGKTTMARCFADILGAIGVLPQGQFIELAGKDLISDVVGGSERNVQEAVDRAMGGVLFIDEAYGLNEGQFGRAAIDKLVPILENERGKFICIIAGYTEDMRNFLKANPGLKSRFNKTIDFPDYNPAELETIFRSMAEAKGLRLDQEASDMLHMEMETIFNKRGADFGNARDMRNLLKRADERRRARQREMPAAEAGREGRLLKYSDITGREAGESFSLEDIMKELDSLVGLEGVKKNIRALAAGVRREQMLSKAAGRTPELIAEHYQFLGNPGTGKTTVARLMGRMLYALGLLSRPDVVEVGRDDLVAGYQGHTAARTKDAVMKAMGGILFIDEAYSLVNSPGDSFGLECINTLVPLLENNRGRFVCICAGYTREMQEFLDANSGLRSRLVRKISFDDYNADELYRIFLLNCRKKGLKLSEGAAEAARDRLQEMYDNRGRDFGNAREVRTFVGEVEARLAERTMFNESATTDELVTILPEDILC
ncbi:MAG: AAA family ATPase [Bacteroidales bacterium]|nr:AAA family ATPase [Candidatus Cryptobacteroides choladohippi]